MGERDAAQPILWPLEDQKHEKIKQIDIQRLRFEYWPEEAADYLLQLQGKDNSSFSISVGEELASSTIGPVDAKLAKDVLGEEGLLAVIKELMNRIKGEDDQAKLRWLATLAPENLPVEETLELLASGTYAYVRCVAAKRLLDGNHHDIALTTLYEIIKNEPNQVPKAVRALLDRDETVHLDWQLLRDVALMPNYSQASRAITTLFKAEDKLTALPAALHLLATCSTEKNRDQRRWKVVESLMGHDQTEVALAAAGWLALQPGSSYRFKACKLLLENGKIEDAIPLLHIFAYECHDKSALQACQRLLIFKQTERVLPLLQKRSLSKTPALRYEASFALAQINFLSSEKEFDLDLYNQTRMAILSERLELYQTVQNDFCLIGQQVLEALEPTNEETHSIVTLGQASLKWLAGSFDVSGEIKPSEKQIYPAVSLNMALFDLRAAHIELAKQRLMTLLTKHTQALSHVIRLEAIKTIGRIRGCEITALLIQFLKDEDSRIRAAAANVLGPRGDTIALQPLISAINDKDKKVREAAIWALRDLGDPNATQPLINALNDEESRVRKAAVRTLGYLGDPKVLQPLIEALSDEDRNIREYAAYGLRELEDLVAFDPLVTALRDKESNVRKAAALALGRLGDSRAVIPLIALLSDKEGSVRENAVYALGELNDSIAVQPLINALNDTNSKVRLYTAQALGKIGDSTAFKPLMMALTDEDRLVCYYAGDALRQLTTSLQLACLPIDLDNSNADHSAALALGHLGHPSALQPLMIYLNHGNKNIRSAAALALGQLGNLDAVDLLVTLLDDEESSIREFAGFAIREFRHITVIYPLMFTLGDALPNVRFSIASALGVLGDSTILQYLIDSLRDTDKQVRLNVAWALGHLGDYNASQSLIAAFIDNNDIQMTSARITEALSRVRTTEAIPLLTSIITPSGNVAFACARALIYLDPASAEPVLDRYARQFHRRGWVEGLRGEMWWSLGNMEQALASFKKALEKKHGDRQLNQLAHFYLEQGDLEQAEEYTQQALKKSPRTPYNLLSLAVILSCMGKQAEALERFKKARLINKRVTDVKGLQYYNFWRQRALGALEEMLAVVEG